MKSNKWMAMAAVAALSTTLAFAGPHEGGRDGERGGKRGGKRGGEFGARFAQKLNLTDAQKQQIRALQEGFRTQNKAFFEQSRETFRQFRDAKKAGDTARVDALKPTIEAQREQMKQLRAEQKQRIVALLTPEQRAQYESMKAERDARRGEHGKRR
jgi:protein CpxP